MELKWMPATLHTPHLHHSAWPQVQQQPQQLYDRPNLLLPQSVGLFVLANDYTTLHAEHNGVTVVDTSGIRR